MSAEWLGWFASVVLVATIGYQVLNQWRTGSSRGVSPWLFVGQFTASATFTAYAAAIGSVVFIVTNGLLAASAVAGFAVCRWHRRRSRERRSARLHHVGLAAADWEASRAFYERGLGAKASLVFEERGLRVAMLELPGGRRIELFETAASATSPERGAGSSEDGAGASAGALVHLAVGVDDVREATARLERLGARVEHAPERTRLRAIEGNGDGDGDAAAEFSFVRGPSGELVELIRFSEA